MKLSFDKVKNRLVSGAADQHVKFHDLTSELVSYNVKLPSPLSSLDFSSDGKHFAIGMIDGSLIIRSKKFTREYTEDGEEIEDPEERIAHALA